MNTTQIRQAQPTLHQHLAGKRIKDALDFLEPLVRATQRGDLIDARYNLELSYKSILKYTTEGINDPERQKIYNHLLISIYQLTDAVMERLGFIHLPDMAYELMRQRVNQPQPTIDEQMEALLHEYETAKLKSSAMPEIVLTQEFTRREESLFVSAWIEGDSQSDALRRLFDNEEVPWHSQALVVSALFLLLMRKWDLPLMLLLLDLTHHPRHQVQMRALTAVIPVLQKYDRRLWLFPEITDRLHAISHDAVLSSHIQTLFIQLIRTRETEKISTKLRDEILPEVIKVHPILKEKLDLDNLAPDSGDDKNPEWEEVFAGSPGLLEKLEEITKWQMEGADVFLTTFQMLKHFPFFNRVSNWFIPFVPTHPVVTEALNDSGPALRHSGLLDHIAHAGALCNSDKYSLMLGIPLMPTAQRDMMGQFFGNELKQMDEIHQDELLINPAKRDLAVSNQYIQDLYRFFRIYPNRHQFEDVFAGKMDYYKNDFFKHLFHDLAPLEQMGEFLFNKGYYPEALEIFILLSDATPDHVGYTQKMAYARLQLKQYPQALQHFLKADLLQPDKAWTLKKIALCYKHLQQPAKALDYYQRAAQLTPDSLPTQAAIGHCLLELGNHEEALRHYFKVEYLDPANTRVWRPIAWCSLVTGKLDQAEKYCKKLIDTEKNAHDWINLGHVHLCRGDKKEALACYRQSILNGHTIEAFLKIFEEDIKQLALNGIPTDDLPILLDQLRYSI